MKKSTIAAIVLVFVAMMAATYQQITQNSVEGGQKVPPNTASISALNIRMNDVAFAAIARDDDSAHSAHSAPIALTDFRGQTVLLNFWASWCAPCWEEFPIFFERLKTRPDAVLLAVSVDTDTAARDAFIAKLAATYGSIPPNVVFAHDPAMNIARRTFGVMRIPETFVMDKAGTIRDKWVGTARVATAPIF